MEINDPRIEAYFNYELSAEEAAAFLEEAKLYPKVWQEIQFKQWMIDGIQDEGRIELKEFIGNRLAEEREESTGKFWYAAAAIAITLVVGFGIAWPYLNHTNRSSENSMVAMDTIYTNNENTTRLSKLNKANPRSMSDSTGLLAHQIPVIVEGEENADVYNSIENTNPSDDADREVEIQISQDEESKQAEGITSAPSAMSKTARADVAASSKFKEPKLLAESQFNEELVTITSFQVKPIQPINYKPKERVAGNVDFNPDRKFKTPAQINNQQAQSVLATPATMEDTVTRKNTIKPIVVEDKFKIVLTRSSSGVPQAYTSSQPSGQGSSYTLILNNFGDANALVYKLGSAFYLGIGNLFYHISMNNQSPWTPKQVTDKSILQQLNP